MDHVFVQCRMARRISEKNNCVNVPTTKYQTVEMRCKGFEELEDASTGADREDVEAGGARTDIIRRVCIFILLTEMCERLCYYGLTGSLKVFLNKQLSYSNEASSSMTTVLPAIVYCTPLLGGFIADTYWGRYKTIVVFSMVYIAGCLLISVASHPSVDSRWMFMLGLFGLVGLGSGGIKGKS